MMDEARLERIEKIFVADALIQAPRPFIIELADALREAWRERTELLKSKSAIVSESLDMLARAHRAEAEVGRLKNAMDVLKNEDQYIDRLEVVREAAERLKPGKIVSNYVMQEGWDELRRALAAYRALEEKSYELQQELHAVCAVVEAADIARERLRANVPLSNDVGIKLELQYIADEILGRALDCIVGRRKNNVC